MAELPEEIIMMKKKWREINEEESEAKKKKEPKRTVFTDVKIAIVISAADMCGYAPNVGSRRKHFICG